MSSEVLAPQLVPIERVHPSPNNPRRIQARDMDRLKRSITEDPKFLQLRPILARPDGSIYAGNMRYAAARALGHGEVWVVFTDDPESVIRQRAVKDNTQLGEWVEEDLAEYVHELAEMDDDLDFGALGLDDYTVRTAGLEDLAGIANEPFPTQTAADLAGEASGGGSGAAGLPRADYDPEKDESGKTLDDAPARLQGALQLTADMDFNEGADVWDIPMLRRDMLLDRAPEPMMCWSDQKTTPPRDDMFYLWNWGIAPATGLPMDRALLCFYTYDHHFENWWELPHFYTGKVLNAGIRMSVVPDFSIYGKHPRAVQLLNVFRAQWMGRYLQEAGIRVVPRLNWGNPDSYEWCFAGIPKEPPVAAICIQTFFTKMDKERDADLTDEDMRRYTEDGLRAAIDIVQPQSLINYGGNPAHRFVAGLDLGIPIMNVMNYAGVRRGVAFDKGAKHTDTPIDEAQNPNLTAPGAFME